MGDLPRRLLLVAGCGVLGARALGCGGSAAQGSTTVDAGAASALPVDTLRAVPGAAAGIGRDSAGIYALSLICTHAGCDLSGQASWNGIFCGCHGSVFDAHGDVLRGPASSPLPHLLVTEDAAGELTIHLDQTVSASTRLPS